MNDPLPSTISAPFIDRMAAELDANKDKGDFAQWHPTAQEAWEELHHHMEKLGGTLFGGEASAERIAEFAADIGNVAMKIFEEFGTP